MLIRSGCNFTSNPWRNYLPLIIVPHLKIAPEKPFEHFAYKIAAEKLLPKFGFKLQSDLGILPFFAFKYRLSFGSAIKCCKHKIGDQNYDKPRKCEQQKSFHCLIQNGEMERTKFQRLKRLEFESK